TYVASAPDPAGTRWRISSPGGTLREIGRPAASSPRAVSRARTGCVPGLASATVPDHPFPPPWGHTHTHEAPRPGPAGPAAAGPRRWAPAAPATTPATSRRAIGPARRLIDAPACA